MKYYIDISQLETKEFIKIGCYIKPNFPQPLVNSMSPLFAYPKNLIHNIPIIYSLCPINS